MIRPRHSDIQEPPIPLLREKCALCIQNLCVDAHGHLFFECWICGEIESVSSIASIIEPLEKIELRPVGEA